MIIQPGAVDWDRPGATHVRLSFGLDGSWGSSLVPLTVINPIRPASAPSSTVAIFGGTHGNEYESQVALTRLCADLDPSQVTGRVIIMPRLSEDACRHGTRAAAEDGVNMNRAFPGDPAGTLSYRIAHFVSSMIIPQAEVILDLHAGGRECAYALCTSLHPLPDPERFDRALDLASLFATPYVFIYSRQLATGLLTDFAEDQGKIAIGGEFGGGETVSPAGVAHVYQGVINVLRRQDVLPGEPEPILGRQPGAGRIVRADNLDDYVPAPCSGLWEPVVPLGSDVRAGQLLGRLYDVDHHPARFEPIRAHRDGVLIACYQRAVCPTGRTLIVIGDPVHR
jgi:predicted deacylase